MNFTPFLLLLCFSYLWAGQLEDADVVEIAEYYGFTADTREVTTQDGYILTNFLIHARGGDTSQSRPQVIVMHGAAANAESFLVNGEDNSIPFFLADSGYDVWLLNLRGNNYSRRHTTLNPDEDEEFWNFDMTSSVEDMRAIMIDALEYSGNEQVSVLGYSLGASIAMIASCIDVEWFTTRINILLALNPALILSGIENRQIGLMTNPILLQKGIALGVREILAPNPFMSAPILTLWTVAPDVWEAFFTYSLSYNSETDDFDALELTLHHYPAGGNIYSALQYSQFRTSGRFHFMDYGIEENLELYGSETAPDYPIEDIQIPVALFTSDYDDVELPEHTDWLLTQLNSLVEHISYPYGHVTPVMCINWEFLDDMLSVLTEYTS